LCFASAFSTLEIFVLLFYCMPWEFKWNFHFICFFFSIVFETKYFPFKLSWASVACDSDTDQSVTQKLIGWKVLIWSWFWISSNIFEALSKTFVAYKSSTLIGCFRDWLYLHCTVDSKREMVGENTLLDQKSHHRCRRRKHDCRMVDALRWLLQKYVDYWHDRIFSFLQ